MIVDLKNVSGLPVALDTDTCKLLLGRDLNTPEYRVRMLHDLDAVWANSVPDADRIIYQYTSGLWFAEDEKTWKNYNVIYGIVVFTPGIFAGEYNKSSGQYHPLMPPNTHATPEIYTVLNGTGHFLLQKALPPYENIEDIVMVEVKKGETFVVPPDYGHLQINPAGEPLVFSYAVMDGMQGVYAPFQKKRGAVYYEMATDRASEKYIFNSNYKCNIPLRQVKASEICQVPLLNDRVTYQKIRDNLKSLEFLTDPEKFPANAAL